MKATDLSLVEKSSRIPKDFLLLALAITIVSVNIIFAPEVVPHTISYLGFPFMKSGVFVGQAIDDSVEAFFSIPYIRAQNAVLQIEAAKLEAENSKLQILLEENAALRKEVEVGSREDKLLEAHVLASDIGVNDSLIIDVGSRNGVKKGDVVRIGSIYIGYIGSVSELTSKVILPNNETSSLEVLLLDNPGLGKEIDTLKSEYSNKNDVARGIVVGDNSTVRVENISRNDNVQTGFAVVVNDPKIEQLLFVGTVTEVIDDPAAPTREAKIRPLLMYDNINYLFVTIK